MTVQENSRQVTRRESLEDCQKTLTHRMLILSQDSMTALKDFSSQELRWSTGTESGQQTDLWSWHGRGVAICWMVMWRLTVLWWCWWHPSHCKYYTSLPFNLPEILSISPTHNKHSHHLKESRNFLLHPCWIALNVEKICKFQLLQWCTFFRIVLEYLQHTLYWIWNTTWRQAITGVTNILPVYHIM